MFTTAWLNETTTSLGTNNHVLFLPLPSFTFTEADELSHDDVREAIWQALKAITPQKDGFYSWVREVFDDSVIYQEETPVGNKLYRRGYTISEDGEALLGPATEVEEVTEYVPVAEGKTEAGVEFPASDYAYVPDPEKPSTWKLRLTSKPGGKPDPKIVGAAVAALGKGFRGKKVQIPEDDLPKVKAKVRAAWKKANPDKGADEMPDVIKEAAGEVEVMGKIIPLVEVSVRADGTVPVKIIEPGWGSSAYYPDDVLERDGPKVFSKGTHMYWDHMTESEEVERPENELDNLAAVLETDARWEATHPAGPGLYADARVFDPFGDKLNELGPHIGVSIHTKGMAESGEADGREGYILTELLRTPHTSVDYVTKPGAGGQVLSLFEAARPRPRKVPMEKELLEAQEKLTAAEDRVKELEAKAELTEAERTDLARFRETRLVEAARAKAAELLKDIDLPEITKTRLVETVSKNPPAKDGELDEEAFAPAVDEAAKAEADYLAKLGEGNGIKGMGGTGEEDDSQRMTESVKRLHPDWTDEQVRIFVTGR